MNEQMIKFKQTEARYNELREKIGRGELTKEQMKDELMRLMVQDENGRYWMLGAKTGNWYVRTGNQWKAADPYEAYAEKEVLKPQVPDQPFPSVPASVRYTPAPAVDLFEFKSKVETEPDKEINEKVKEKDKDIIHREYDEANYTDCRMCKSRIPNVASYCHFCGAPQKEPQEYSAPKENVEQDGESLLIIKSVTYMSFMFFCGGLGLICGVLIGATFGIIKTFLPDIAREFLPLTLSETRGGISGGMIFAAIGGIGGFLVSSILALVLGSIYNLIAYVFGGIRLNVKQKK